MEVAMRKGTQSYIGLILLVWRTNWCSAQVGMPFKLVKRGCPALILAGSTSNVRESYVSHL